MPQPTIDDAKAASDAIGATLDLGNGATIAVYSLDPAREAEFIQFYQNTALSWLNARGMKDGKGWIVNHLLIYTGSPDPPWNGMPGLAEYLSKEHPPIAQELPYDDGSGDTSQVQSAAWGR